MKITEEEAKLVNFEFKDEDIARRAAREYLYGKVSGKRSTVAWYAKEINISEQVLWDAIRFVIVHEADLDKQAKDLETQMEFWESSLEYAGTMVVNLKKALKRYPDERYLLEMLTNSQNEIESIRDTIGRLMGA